MRAGISLLFVFLVDSFAASVFAAEEFDTYLKQQQQGVQNSRAEFQRYLKEQDREFADFLKSQWSEFETFKGKVRIKEPKPKEVPVAVPSTPVKPAPEQPRPAPEIPKPAPVIKPPAAPPVVQPVAPPPAPLPQPTPAPIAPNTLEIMFYGNAVSFKYDPQWKSYRITGAVKPEAMSAFWMMMGGSDYEPTLRAVAAAKRDLKLDDWGEVMLWREVAQALQPGHTGEQSLLLWFFLVKSGFDVRLGYSGNDVHLFVSVGQAVYATQFIKVGNQAYYAVLDADYGKSIRSLYTYDSNYPGKLDPVDIQTVATGFARTEPAKRTLVFDYRGKRISLDAAYDQRMVEYLGTVPQSDFDLYFDTPGSSELRKVLLPELKQYMAGMDEDEAVNFLLDFVQHAFAYKTDDEQFGHEKYFFVEESMYFPYNDCEDRAVFFAWLVRELVGIKVVGLQYPGHMTTAVALKQVKPGYATVSYAGSRYVIADPTYIGASAGMAMPSYQKLNPTRVVEIR